jgi:hypothetical protein
MAGEERQDESVTAQLIRDIAAVFSANGHDRMKTADLLAELHENEDSPWGDWYGKPLSPHGLSRLLKPYRIRTMPVWTDGKTVKGFKVEQFADAFAQLGVRTVRTVRSESGSHAAPNPPNPPNPLAGEGGENGRPLVGDDGYLEHLFAAFEAGHVTESEWRRGERAHRFVERGAA